MQELVLQMMDRSGMLLTVADDDADYCVLAQGDVEHGNGSIIEVSRDLFDAVAHSDMVERIPARDGEWYRYRGAAA